MRRSAMRPCDRQCAVHVLYEDFWWLYASQKNLYFSAVHTLESSHPRDRCGGAEELDFARVGGGRPDLAEGRGLGTEPPLNRSRGAHWPVAAS
eukprot:scaffold19579_cov140-Isochrysis_galbana.AAC.1